MGCWSQVGDRLRLGVRQRVCRGGGSESRLFCRIFWVADDRSCTVCIKTSEGVRQSFFSIPSPEFIDLEVL